MSTFTIGEVAARTGFSASTLRYYEGVGLLPTPARTDAGYRFYDEDAIARLRFIARAKQLGCTLEEITDLVRAWEGGHCAPVFGQLQILVENKLGATAERITELGALTHELERAAASLSSGTTDGPCDDSCACMSTDDDAGDAGPSVRRGRPVIGATPVACTLDPSEISRRLEDWQRVLSFVIGREAIEGGLRLVLDSAVDVGDVARLMHAEQACCQFFAFALTVDNRGLGVDVRAPEAAQEIVSALFGDAARCSLSISTQEK
jgi:DNA-binding transcriptional MerR regulator